MRVEDQVQTTERALATPDGPGEGLLENVGRWNMGPAAGLGVGNGGARGSI